MIAVGSHLDSKGVGTEKAISNLCNQRELVDLAGEVVVLDFTLCVCEERLHTQG